MLKFKQNNSLNNNSLFELRPAKVAILVEEFNNYVSMYRES